ncbi:ATP-binding cassette domain-containing protein [Lacticaseibacillus hulanensis]|uniref:ATP-binding cassette domain-containing protein n=1 Tax=Lacticaseibacillus hulanensis TaxID=2493111 RepID=UPI000FDC8B23|nr:ABC transporter ATP-binding protein [Lacticaseibacillus hulanensis]
MTLKYYLGKHKVLVFVAVVLTLLSIIGQTIGTMFWTPMIDALARRSTSTFWWWFTIDTVFSLVRFGVGQIDDYLQTVATQRINVDMQRDLSNGVANQSLPEFQKGSVGQYTSWLTNDIQQIDTKGLATFFNIVMYGGGIVFPLVSLIWYHWSLGVAAIVCGLIMTIAPRVLQHKVEQGSERVTRANEHFVNVAENTLNGFETFLSFRHPQEIVRRIVAAAGELKDTNLSYKRRELAVEVLTYTGSIFAQMFLIGLTGWLVLRGTLTAGALMTTGQQAGIVFTSMAQLASLLVVRKAVNPVFAKYAHLNFKKTPDDEPFTRAPVGFELANVASGDAEHTWLAPISAKVAAGSKVHLTGPSGKGKTTLLHLIAGLTKPTSGVIKWPEAPAALYLPQKPFILSASVRENLTLGRDYSDEQLWRVLDQVGLTPRIRALNSGLSTKLSADGVDLSGGERERLALARALLVNPGVLLFDEGTASVDAQTAETIERQILTNSQQTVVFVSHAQRSDLEPLFDQTIEL